jgi:hypothetical protein
VTLTDSQRAALNRVRRRLIQVPHMPTPEGSQVQVELAADEVLAILQDDGTRQRWAGKPTTRANRQAARKTR